MSFFNTALFERQGNTEQDHSLDSTVEIRAAIIKLSETTLRSIKIFSPDLEPLFYDNDPLRTTLLSFVRGNRHASIRILTEDITNALHNGHRLIQLSRQLTSAIQIRKLPDDYTGHHISFVLSDQSRFIFKADHNRHDAFQSACKNRSHKLADFFDLIWEQSTIDPRIQQFHI